MASWIVMDQTGSMQIINIGSGSKGNSTLIVNTNTCIMIDAGIGIRRVQAAMKQFNIDTVHALLITHSHSDHICGLKYLNGIDCYSFDSTVKSQYHLANHQTITIGSFTIMPFKISHDAPDCCGFLIKDNDESLFYCTDCGYVNDEMLSIGNNCTSYIMESNHDIDMLLHSSRPYYLKARILGDEGHLSNEDALKALNRMIGKDTRSIYLAHVSQQCNDYQLAYEVINQGLKDNPEYKHIDIKVFKQNEIINGGHL